MPTTAHGMFCITTDDRGVNLTTVTGAETLSLNGSTIESVRAADSTDFTGR
ncbi:MAG: hypothetical protein AAGL98_16210 [Planctomycetota bacterium]